MTFNRVRFILLGDREEDKRGNIMSKRDKEKNKNVNCICDSV